MINGTYCGNDCAKCVHKEALNCPGCMAGPGRKFQTSCKLAKCCADKGHQTCTTCSHVTSCGTYRHRFEMASDRIREREQAAAFLEQQTQKAGKMEKWLWILFWMFIPAAIGSLMTEDFVVNAVPGLLLPGVVITMVSNLAYAAVLFKLKNVNDRYLTAAGWMAASALLSGLMGIKDAGWTEFDPGMLLTIPTAIAGLLGIYQECKAHSEAMLGIDEDLFVQWENYWKWRIGLVAATFACILLIIISKILTLLVLLAVAIGTIVLSILRLVYLYRSAAACRYHLYHYNAKKENTV